MQEIMDQLTSKATEVHETVIKSLMNMAGVNTNHTDLERLQREMDRNKAEIASETNGSKTIYTLTIRGKAFAKGEVWYELDLDRSKATIKRKLTPMVFGG